MIIDNALKLFPIRPTSIDNDWKSIQRSYPALSDWGLRTLRHGLANHAKSVIIEPYYICKDHRNLYSNFYSKKFIGGASHCNRFHFFSKEINHPAELVCDTNLNDSYLGYSVIRPVHERCIGRTVIDPFKIGKDLSTNTFCLRTAFKVNIEGVNLSVRGYPYTSQDTDATVCAHSALWGVCRYLSERYSSYSEVYPYDLIRMTGRSGGRTVPYRGMTYLDYSEILSQFRCHPVVMRTKKISINTSIDEESFKNIYSYVESGFPVLASLPHHVVALIGHTIDYEKVPTPDSDGFIDSSVFLKQFVAVDDNCFPYALLGYENDPDNYARAYKNTEYPNGYSIDKINTAVIPLPEKAFLPAERARKKAFLCLKNEGIKGTTSAPLVIRLFLTTSSAFKTRKLKATLDSLSNKPDKLLNFIRSIRMPHFIWVMEISTLESYKKGHSTGEIVIDATAGSKEHGLLYMRMGNTLTIEGIRKTISDCPNEFKQYTHNLGEVN